MEENQMHCQLLLLCWGNSLRLFVDKKINCYSTLLKKFFLIFKNCSNRFLELRPSKIR